MSEQTTATTMNVIGGAAVGATLLGVLQLIFGMASAAGPNIQGALVGGIVVYVIVRLRQPMANPAPRDSEFPGFATTADVIERFGEKYVRRSALSSRPRISDIMAVNVLACGLWIGNAVQSAVGRCFVSFEDVIMILGPPRQGKTGLLAQLIRDTPGAVVSTSTKVDIYRHTAFHRASTGSPIYVWNPEHLSDLASDIRWSPIVGCEEPKVAISRAKHFLSGASPTEGVKNKTFWESNVNRALTMFLWIAAVEGLTLADVYDWGTDDSDTTPLELIRNMGKKAPRGWTRQLAQIYNTPEETRKSIFLTLTTTFQFMANPDLATIVSVSAAESTFNADDLITKRGTLYLIGSAAGAVGPLFAALTGHIYDTAKYLASTQTDERLDPPLQLALDEAPLVCPVPLHIWTSEGGGQGIQCVISLQGRSQLEAIWGQANAMTIWNNSLCKIVMPGISDERLLDSLSKLAGAYDREVTSVSASQNGTSQTESTRQQQIMSPSQIREIPDNLGLLIYGNRPPLVLRTRRVWDQPTEQQRRRPVSRRRNPAPGRRTHRPVAGVRSRAALAAEAGRTAATRTRTTAGDPR